MAELVPPSTPSFAEIRKEDVDARDKRGHDDGKNSSITSEHAFTRPAACISGSARPSAIADKTRYRRSGPWSGAAAHPPADRAGSPGTGTDRGPSAPRSWHAPAAPGGARRSRARPQRSWI